MDKPLAELRQFAGSLGWRGLRLRQQVLDDHGRVITWYETGRAERLRDDFFLQINECPMGQVATYTAAVYALRYRICTGWHSMKLTRDGRCDENEVARLDPWLHRRWFDSLHHRRQFRTLHPECSGWSWKRIGTELPPYHVVDAKRCVIGRTS